MFGMNFTSRTLLAAVTVGVIAGCSSIQSTPMSPTQPARIGSSDGVTREQDAACRRLAHQDAQSTKETNVAKEVGSTVAGAALGAVLGNALEPGRPRHRGPGPRGPGRAGPGRRGPRGGPGRRGPGRPSDPGYGTAGAVTGAVAGAAVSQALVEDTQQVYDRRYNNCIAAYANAIR